MYKVFLVDDETEFRHYIKENIQLSGTDFFVAGEAPDGEKALPLIKDLKPDIIITDVIMPFMDGFQLSHIIKKSMPWIKLIILSEHSEFEFVKEAINIGVTDYLLKSAEPCELMKSLNKAAMLIENEKKDKDSVEMLQKILDSNVSKLKDIFLNEVSLGLVPATEIIEKCHFYNIDIIARYYLVMIIEMDMPKRGSVNNEYREFLEAETIIHNIIDQRQDIITFKRQPKEVVLIIKSDGNSDMESSALNLANTIKYEVESNTSHRLTISIGSKRERFKGIAESLKDAEAIRNCKNIFAKNKILYTNDIKISFAAKRNFVNLDKVNILDCLKYGSKADMLKVIDEYTEKLEKNKISSFIYIYYLFMDIVIVASKFVTELGGDIGDIVPEIKDLEYMVSCIDSLQDFKTTVEGILSRIFEFRDSRVENKYEIIIDKAKEYINNHFFESNISLETIANYVNISPSYFSSIFSQETGETFIDYLTKIRIKKAMELLKTTTQKCSEIGYSIGYNNPHYFSYLFKKIVGVTPKEFRSE